MAGIFAISTALMIGLAGLIAGVRYTTILLRALAGFFLSGALVYIVFFLLDKYGMPAYLKKNPVLQKEWISDNKVLDDSGKTVPVEDRQETEDEHADAKDGQEDEEEQEGKKEFTPLAANGLKHVSSPQNL